MDSNIAEMKQAVLKPESEGELRKAFWDRLIARHPVEQTYQKATKRHFRWRRLERLHLVVAQSVMPETNQACVYIRAEEGDQDWTKARQRLEPISRELKAITRRPMGTKYFFIKWKPFDLKNEAEWDKVADWLHETANAYQEALERVMIA
jgi:hypothetical protein